MALQEQILGSNVYVFHGSTLVGCAKSIKVSGSRTEIDTTCSGTGDVQTAKTGKAKYTWSIDMLWRQATSGDIATSITPYTMIDNFVDKTEVTISFKNSGTLVSGDEVYTGVGYLTQFDLSGDDDAMGAFSCSGFFNSLTPTKTT